MGQLAQPHTSPLKFKPARAVATRSCFATRHCHQGHQNLCPRSSSLTLMPLESLRIRASCLLKSRARQLATRKWARPRPRLQVCLMQTAAWAGQSTFCHCSEFCAARRQVSSCCVIVPLDTWLNQLAQAGTHLLCCLLVTSHVSRYGLLFFVSIPLWEDAFV